MNVYEKLRQMLDKHPAGAPQSAAFMEILETLFTPEEAAVALGMGFAMRTAERVAEESGVPLAETMERLESMADKGIVFSREHEGKRIYALLPTIPGLFEFPFMKGGGTPLHDKLGKLWEEYHREALGNEFAGSETPLARVIPLQNAVDTRTEVLPYEVVSSMLDKCETFALAQCACRVSLGKCDKPRDVCLVFGRAGRFLIERGFAKELSREETNTVIKRAEDAGLVHTTNNSRDQLNFLCNCCPCCCTILRGLTELENPRAFAVSRWKAEVDTELCSGCGVCEDERCPVGAIKVTDGLATVDDERCIGCGLCVSTCDTEAVSMVLRERPPAAPETVRDMGIQVAKEKGKLEEFIKLMKR